MNTKVAMAIAVTSVMVALVAVAISPLLASQAHAARTTTCDIGGSTRTGTCPGNSGSNGNPNQCQTTKAGQGQGSGEIKGSSC